MLRAVHSAEKEIQQNVRDYFLLSIEMEIFLKTTNDSSKISYLKELFCEFSKEDK